MHVIGLGIRPREDGGWDVRIGRPGTPPASGVVPDVLVRGVRRAMLDMPDADDNPDTGAWARREARVSRALGAALERTGAPARAWSRAIARAEARDKPLMVALDVSRNLRDVAWELLPAAAGQASLEQQGRGMVVRLVGDGTGVSTPCPEFVHPVVDALADDVRHHPVLGVIRSAWQGAGRGDVSRLGERKGAHVATLLFEEDGRRGLESVLAGSATDAGPLADAAADAELVWPVVTAGDLLLDSPLRRLPAALVRAGAVAALGGDTRVDRDAAAAMAAGMHHALLKGETLYASVVAGRAAMRELDLPLPDARWWRVRLHVPHLDHLLHTPVPRATVPRGWPTPDDRVAELIATAQLHAEADGFLGVEQLAEALYDRPVAGLEALASAIGVRRDIWRTRSRHLAHQPAAGALRPTPRLTRAVRRLDDGFDAAALWQAILAEPDGWRRWLGDVVLPGRPHMALAHDAREPASALEVLGGPEDGLRFRPEPGQYLGRHAVRRMSELTLYATTRRVDPRLSRRHLRWLGDGWVHLYAPARILKSDQPAQMAPLGPLEVRAGDMLELTPTTWILGLGRAAAAAAA